MASPLRRVTVTSQYKASAADRLRVGKGDRIRVGRDDAERPEWRWCTAPDGRVSWVHQELFDLDQTGSAAVMRRDYAAAELTVQPGDVLDVLEELGGWLLCRSSTGAVGWVPVDGTQALWA